MNIFFEISSSPAEFVETIKLRHPAWDVIYLPEHPSTQQMAKDAFYGGSSESGIFITANQTSGRGRYGRGWVSSPEGKDLTMTLLFPMDFADENPALLNLIGGISVAEALSDLTNHDFKVKWPNDIFYSRAKIGGIISELLISEDLTSIAMGIGVNINSPKDFFSDIDSLYEINSVSSVIGKKVNLALVVIEIIDRLQSNLILLDLSMYHQLHKKWNLKGLEKGKKIRYREIGGEWLDGIADEITTEGYLTIRDSEGNVIKNLVEGDVVPLFDLG